MLRLFRKLVFWTVVLLVLKHSFTMVEQLVSTFSDSTRAAVSATNLRRIDSALQREHLMEGSYPSDFDAFMARSFHGSPDRTRLDSWGEPFRYEWRPAGYVLGSAGPDRRFETGDDLVIMRRGKRVTARLYPAAARRIAYSRARKLPILTRIRYGYTKFAVKVRREFNRLRAEVRKARREQTLKRAQPGSSRQ